MRPIWSGSLSFSLVNIPVKLYSATTSATLDMNLFRADDLSPIRYVRIAEADGKEVAYEDLVRGYQYRKGEYVILTDDDFKNASIKKTRSIEIRSFVDEDEIDPLFYLKPYYLEPDRGADKPYALLAAALKESKKVGVALFVLKNREHLTIIKAHDDSLVLNQLRFSSEIRDPGELAIPSLKDTDRQELELAISIIKKLSRRFKAADYKDTYNKELMRMIEAKAQGKEIHVIEEEPQPTKIADLMAVLKQSLEMSSKS